MSKSHYKTKFLCFCAIMSALFVALEFASFSPYAPYIEISMSAFPIYLAAIYFGPAGGAAVALVGGFLAQLLRYGISYNMLYWMAPDILRGLAMGFLFIAFKKSYRFRFICIEMVIASLIATAANTAASFIDAHIFSYPYGVAAAIMVPRVLFSIATTAIMACVFIPCHKALKRIL